MRFSDPLSTEPDGLADPCNNNTERGIYFATTSIRGAIDSDMPQSARADVKAVALTTRDATHRATEDAVESAARDA